MKLLGKESFTFQNIQNHMALLYTNDALLEQYMALDGPSLQNLIVAGFQPTDEWKQEWLKRHPLTTERIKAIFKLGGKPADAGQNMKNIQNIQTMRKALDREGELPPISHAEANAFFKGIREDAVRKVNDSQDYERALKIFRAFAKGIKSKP